MKIEHNKNLDELNNKRVYDSKEKVAVVHNDISRIILSSKDDLKKLRNEIADSINTLESVITEMNYACEYNEWNSGVVMQMEDAVSDLGDSLANLISFKEYDDIMVECPIKDAKVKLSMALATLENWFEDEDDSEGQD